MMLKITKISFQEFKKLFFNLIFICITFLLLFSTTNTLSVLGLSLTDSFYSSYENSFIHLSSVGFDKLDDICEIASGFTVELYGLTGYTQVYTNNLIEYPSFSFKGKEISACTECYMIYYDGGRQYLSVKEYESLLAQMEYENCGQENFTITKTTCNGIFSYIDNNLKKKIEKWIIEYDPNVVGIPVFISSLIAEELDIKVSDEITFTTKTIQKTVTVKGIYNYKFLPDSFYCDFSFLDFSKETFDRYYMSIVLTDNSKYTKMQKFVEENFNSQSYQLDNTFLRLQSLLSVLNAVVISLTVIFWTVSIIVCYGFIDNIIEKRKKFIYQLKLLGAVNGQITVIYLIILIPLIIASIIPSIFLARFYLNIIAGKFSALFGWTLSIRLLYLPPILLTAVFIVFIGFVILKLLKSKKKQITYSLYKSAQ